MNLWKYYDGDLKYPNLDKHSTSEIEIAKTNPKWAFDYAKIHGKDIELERIISKSAKYSYEYANQILKKPFKLGEPAIATDASFSFLYANDVLNGKRFKLGEPTIVKDPESAIEYAWFILKKPWKEAEQYIVKDDFNAKQYTHAVLKRDFYFDGKLICEYDEDEDY